jgi:potassium efflux system protein
LLLAGLALAGYFYTATTLINDLINTLWLVLGLIVVQQLAERWLLLTRRKLAYQAAIERDEAERLAGEIDEPVPVGGGGVPIEEEEPEVDLIALSEETSKLLNTALVIAAIVGLWFIWSGELPAFGLLNDVSLWHHVAVVSGQEQQVPITLADLGLAILIAVVTVVVAKSLPALLEIVLLQRLDVSAGSRYAVTNLSTYLIAAVGGLLAFNALGASWSQVQWLVAALSVGIGFGLQEIVANFISGLIILFERPIRVGDFVTVGNTDGVVTRIRIRATTIRNQDRKELLVPNKEFITGRLLNWSLSDPTIRILLSVGVAYGSDVRRAMTLLIEAAEENQSVLAEPEPSVIFETFGDNALNLLLRCFVESVDLRFPTISELNQAIKDKFEQAGIVIAFPQRDVHLDTSGPLDVRIRRASSTRR